MRQARDLLYRKVHLGSNPNPGASPARLSSGSSHQMFYSYMAGQPGLVRMRASLAPSSICLAEMPPTAAHPNTRDHLPHTPLPDPRYAHEHPHPVRSTRDGGSVECMKGSAGEWRMTGGGRVMGEWGLDSNSI